MTITPVIDAKKAFLHGDLEEEAYMELLSDSKKPLGEKWSRLKKSLYSLKQSSRALFQKFTKSVCKRGIFKAK